MDLTEFYGFQLSEKMQKLEIPRNRQKMNPENSLNDASWIANLS